MSGSCRQTYDQNMRVIRTALAMLAISGLVLAPAAAAKQYAPPGKAGTSEYAEDIPTAGGNVSTPAMGGGNRTAAQIDKLGAGKAGVRKLTKLGTTGSAAAQFAQQTAPAVSTRASSTTGTSGHPTGKGAPGHTTPASTTGGTAHGSKLNAAGESALGGLWGTISGSDGDGIGAVLPLLLAFGLGLAVALMVVRLRRDAQQPPA
jgi:hypothetical protein